MSSIPPVVLLLRLLTAICVLPLQVAVSQSSSSSPTSPSPSSSPTLPADTICPGLTEFNSEDNNIPQTATFLDLTFQCVYDTDNPGVPFEYDWIKPTSTIRIEPGDRVAFFSTPPDAYRVESFRDDQVFLVQTVYGAGGTDGTTPPPPPAAFALTITFPPAQLLRLRISGTTAGDANVAVAPGFVRLRELNATLLEGGLDAVLSTEGELSLRIRGEAYGGVRIQAANGTAGASTELIVDVENGAGDIQIQGTILNGTVNAVDTPLRSGSVLLDGDILDSVTATGDGPGLLLATDCPNVIGGNCTSLLDSDELDEPNVVNTCQFAPGCITRSVSKVDPDNASGPLLSCSNVDVLECAPPTEVPSAAPFAMSSSMPSVAAEGTLPTPPPSSSAAGRRTIAVPGILIMFARWGCSIMAS